MIDRYKNVSVWYVSFWFLSILPWIFVGTAKAADHEFCEIPKQESLDSLRCGLRHDQRVAELTRHLQDHQVVDGFANKLRGQFAAQIAMQLEENVVAARAFGATSSEVSALLSKASGSCKSHPEIQTWLDPKAKNIQKQLSAGIDYGARKKAFLTKSKVALLESARLSMHRNWLASNNKDHKFDQAIFDINRALSFIEIKYPILRYLDKGGMKTKDLAPFVSSRAGVDAADFYGKTNQSHPQIVEMLDLQEFYPDAKSYPVTLPKPVSTGREEGVAAYQKIFDRVWRSSQTDSWIDGKIATAQVQFAKDKLTELANNCSRNSCETLGILLPLTQEQVQLIADPALQSVTEKATCNCPQVQKALDVQKNASTALDYASSGLSIAGLAALGASVVVPPAAIGGALLLGADALITAAASGVTYLQRRQDSADQAHEFELVKSQAAGLSPVDEALENYQSRQGARDFRTFDLAATAVGAGPMLKSTRAGGKALAYVGKYGRAAMGDRIGALTGHFGQIFSTVNPATKAKIENILKVRIPLERQIKILQTADRGAARALLEANKKILSPAEYADLEKMILDPKYDELRAAALLTLGQKVERIDAVLKPLQAEAGTSAIYSATVKTADEHETVIVIKNVDPKAAGELTYSAEGKGLFDANSFEGGTALPGVIPIDQGLSKNADAVRAARDRVQSLERAQGKPLSGPDHARLALELDNERSKLRDLEALIPKKNQKIEELLKNPDFTSGPRHRGTQTLALWEGKYQFVENSLIEAQKKLGKPLDVPEILLFRSRPVTSDVDIQAIAPLRGRGPRMPKADPVYGDIAMNDPAIVESMNKHFNQARPRRPFKEIEIRIVQHGSEDLYTKSGGVRGYPLTAAFPGGRLDVIPEGPPGDPERYFRIWAERLKRETEYDFKPNPLWGW